MRMANLDSVVFETLNLVSWSWVGGCQTTKTAQIDLRLLLEMYQTEVE